jgi:hypothetical protein
MDVAEVSTAFRLLTCREQHTARFDVGQADEPAEKSCIQKMEVDFGRIAEKVALIVRILSSL